MGVSKRRRIHSVREHNITLLLQVNTNNHHHHNHHNRPEKGLSRGFLFFSLGKVWCFLLFVLISTRQTSALTPEIQSKENRGTPSHNSESPQSRDDELFIAAIRLGARLPIPQLFEGLPFLCPQGLEVPMDSSCQPGSYWSCYPPDRRELAFITCRLSFLHFIPCLLTINFSQEI